MKSCIVTAVLWMTAFSAAWAQASIKAGVQIATVREQNENVSREDIDNHSIIGPVVGLTYDLNVSDILTIQPELIYSQSGGRNQYVLLDQEFESTYRINYLEIPVLVKLELGNEQNEPGQMGFYLAAGPWAGFALSGKRKFESPLGTVEDTFTFDDEDNAKRLNYGLLGALGLNLGRAVVDLRYNFGLNNLLDEDADNNNDNKPILQTRGIALTLGLTF